MTRSTALKMSLLGALLSFGVFAGGGKEAKMEKKDASFVDEAAYLGKAQVRLSELASTKSENASVRQFAQQVIDDHTKNFASLKEAAGAKGITLPFESISSTGKSTSAEGSAPSMTESAKKVGTEGKDTANEVAGTAKSTTESAKSGSMNEAPGEVATGVQGAGNEVGAGAKDMSKSAKEWKSTIDKKYGELSKLSGAKFDHAYLSDVSGYNERAIKLFEKESKSGQDADFKTWATNALPTLKQQQDRAKSVEHELKGKTPSM